jgi:predicted nucleic acid-binding Zn ribbon protein
MDERKRTSNETPLKDLIDKLMKAYQLDGKLNEMTVLEAWPEMMGIAVANRTVDLKIRNKTLYITMDSSVMRDELAHGKTIILHRVNEKAGYEMITDVWFG